MTLFDLRDELVVLIEPLQYISTALDELNDLSKDLRNSIDNKSNLMSKFIWRDLNEKYRLASFLILGMIHESDDLINKLSDIELNEFKEEVNANAED